MCGDEMRVDGMCGNRLPGRDLSEKRLRRRKCRAKAVVMGVIAVMLLLAMTSCVGQEPESENGLRKRNWARKGATYVDEDGWVYRCSFHYSFDGRDQENIAPITVPIMNLRYRMGNPEITFINQVSSAAASDMEKLAQFLGHNNDTEHKSVEEILAQDWDALEFEVLDKEIIYDLIHQVVAQEVRPCGSYLSLSPYGLLNEKIYTDGYQFQIGYSLNWGTVDVIMIDVLYQTGATAGEYVQLSDMVENGQATVEHMELYRRLKEIEEGIKAENDFCYGMAEYSAETIASVDLSRLYQMLSDTKAGDSAKYRFWDELDENYEPESEAVRPIGAVSEKNNK